MCLPLVILMPILQRYFNILLVCMINTDFIIEGALVSRNDIRISPFG